MSKRIVMSIITSLVASVICTVGSFCCKGPTSNRVTLIVQHPDSCFLLEPNPMAAGTAMNADMVSVRPGMVSFKFDCNGTPVTVQKKVKAGQFIMRIDPTGGSQDMPDQTPVDSLLSNQ